MKKLYSLVVVFALIGSAVSFAGQPRAQKHQHASLNAMPSVSVQKLPNINFNPGLSSARQIQQVNNTQAVFFDNFDLPGDTDALAARGYHTYYRGGGAQASSTWFTGNSSVFASHSGASDSYVAANFQVVSGANDIDSWLVLPSFNLTTSDVISFYSTSPPASPFPDSIKVMYSDLGDSVPEATSWVLVGEFQVSTTGWEQKVFNVPAASATGRWAIRYSVVDGGPSGANSNYIGIDDLLVGELPADDAAMVWGYPAHTFASQYTIIPFNQIETIQLEAQVENGGANTETNVGFDASVFVSHDMGTTWSVVFNGPSNAAASLAPTAMSGILSAGAFDFTDTGLYAFQYISFMDNADLDSANDVKTSFILVNDTSYARDNVVFGGSASPLGAPANSTATFGNIYDFITPSVIKSVTLYHAFSQLGGMIRADIYDVSGGEPNSVIASSADYTYGPDDTSSSFLLELTIPLASPLSVPAGPIFVSITQLDLNNMGLGLTSDNFTPGTSFIQVDSDPFDLNENFGLAGTWAVRPNLDLNDAVAQPVLSKGISVYPNPSNGKIYVFNGGQKENMTVTVFNNMGQVVYDNSFSQLSTAVVDLTAQSAGVYTVQVKSEKEITTKSIVISSK